MKRPWGRDRREAEEPREPSQGGDAPATPVGPAATPEPAPPTSAAEVAAELATIDAADSDRILRRAIELGEPSLAVEQFPVGGLEQVAAELHVPLPAVAEALAEYRAGGLDDYEPGRVTVLVERLVGPRRVTVRSRTGLPEEQVVSQLDQWLRRRHRLRTRVNREGTVVAIRRRGLLTGALRQVRGATGSAGLSGLREVRGAAVSTGEGQTMLCVVADLGEQRSQSVAAGSAVAIGGAAVVASAAVVTAPVTLIGVPMSIGAGWVVSRLSHRRLLRRVREEMEITTDSVAAGAAPATRLQGISERLQQPRVRD